MVVSAASVQLMLFSVTLASPAGWIVDGMVGDTHSSFDVDNDIIEKSQRVPKGCGGKPVDVYFVFDTANDVTSELLEQQTEYASNLVRVFHFGDETARVGALSYGDTVLLNSHLRQRSSWTELSSVFKSTPRVGGKRDNGMVLDYLRRKAFSSDVARQDVGHVVILFVSGPSINPNVAALHAHLAKDAGIYIYVVGVGNNIKKEEMTNVASKPASDFIFSSSDYSIADSLVDLLSIHICNIQINPPVINEISKGCIAARPVDLIFALDQSSIGIENTRRLLNFMDELVEEMDHSSDNININLLSGRSINFGDFSKKFNTIQDFDSNLDTVKISDYSDILRRARRQFARGRFHVQKTLLLFIDENVEINKGALIEAKRNKFSKIDTYVVAIGEHLDNISLNILASGPDDQHLIRISSYSELAGLRNWTLKRLCRGW